MFHPFEINVGIFEISLFNPTSPAPVGADSDLETSKLGVPCSPDRAPEHECIDKVFGFSETIEISVA